MKKLFLSLFIFVTTLSSAQNYSGYDFVIVPDRFDFLVERNEYNLNELAKFLIAKKGPASYFQSEDKPIEYSLDFCNSLIMNVTKEKAFLNTKLKVSLQDCNGNIIAESTGSSKEKDNRVAYNYALREAFDLLYLPPKEPAEKKLKPISDNATTEKPDEPKDPAYLYAEKTPQGYKLYDSEKNEKYTLFKTSKNDQFIVSDSEINGALYKSKNETHEWILEYLKGEQVVTKTLKIKF